jgi:predicted RecA/RadA family phage recombinase
MALEPYIAQSNIDKIQVTAPATISSGDVVEIGGNLRGIAIADAASGDQVAIQRSGLAKNVTKAAPLVITAGDLLYWSDSGDEVTKTDTDKPFGIAAADAASSAVLVDVYLNAGSFSEAAQIDQCLTAAAVGTSGNVVEYAGADRTTVDSGISADDLPTMAAVGGAGNLVQTAAADRAQSDAGIAVADVPTQAAAATAANQLLVAAGADKTQRGADAYVVPASAGNYGAELRIFDAQGNYQGYRAEDAMGSDLTISLDNILALAVVTITVSAGANTGSSGAAASLVGGTVVSCVAVSGSDAALEMAELQGDGSVDVTCLANQTAETTYKAIVQLP